MITRMQGATAFSFGSHAAVFGLFLALHAAKPAQTPVLHEVDFIDLKPAPVAAPAEAPAQAPPRGLADFLKMALPKLRPSGPQEAPSEPREAMQLPKLPEMQRLVGKSGPLQRDASLKLDARLERGAAANMADLSRQAPSASQRAAAMESLDAPKTISLDAVGRRAVGTAGPAIRIEGNAPVRASMADLPSVPRGAGGGGGAAMAAPAAIDLKEGAPARRGGGSGMPGGALPIGYSRGSGISLAERPAGRPAAALPAAPVAPSAPKAAEIKQAEGSNKAVEISGPLAGRKILSMSLPAYPDWARAQGVETDVMIRFFVGPDGLVMPRMFLERASGYKELDDACKEALRKIVFVPLTGGSKEEQWGVITFRFRLK